MQNQKGQTPTFIEKSLQHLIAGYKGYSDAQDIMEADRKIREHIISGLNEMRSKIDVKKLDFTESIQTINSLSALESVTASLKLVAETLRYAPEASPSFDYSSFDASKCEKMKAFDEYLYFSLQEIKSVIDSICGAREAAELKSGAAKVAGWSEKYLSQIKSRKEML